MCSLARSLSKPNDAAQVITMTHTLSHPRCPCSPFKVSQTTPSAYTNNVQKILNKTIPSCRSLNEASSFCHFIQQSDAQTHA